MTYNNMMDYVRISQWLKTNCKMELNFFTKKKKNFVDLPM